MKKIFTLVLLCATVYTVSAQQTLLSNEMLQFGSVLDFRYTNSLSVIDTTIQGTNATWDFSALTDDVNYTDLLITISNPASTPFASTFPLSNYCYVENNSGSTAYRYFNLTADKMERVGSFTTSAKIYSDPQTEYVFPTTYGTVNDDTWQNSSSTTGGSYGIKCIGSGTLILPSGTYNALLVRVRLVEGPYAFDVYFWYSSDNGAMLLEYFIGDGFVANSWAFYLHSLTTNVSINEDDLISDLRYNNPVDNNLTLSFRSEKNEDYTISVINTIGQTFELDKLSMNAGNTETVNVDLSNFSAGIYLLNIHSSKSGKVCKSIKLIKK
jgi:hypothetical protein